MARRTHARGAAFISALWVVVALTGVALVLSQTMRVESMASANRLSEIQAVAVERGAEQMALSIIDQEISIPGTMDSISFEARQIGGGYFWVMRPDPDNEQNRSFGLTDEGGKLDLNTAPSEMLAKLPNVTQDIVDSIIDWRDADSNVTGNGAEDSYYASLPIPYHCKNAPFESVDELLLVKGMTVDILYHLDRNHDGMLDDREITAAGTGGLFSSGDGTGRGLAPYVTVYGLKASAPPTGQRLADVNTPNETLLRNVLTQTLSGGRINDILTLTASGRPFRNLFDYAIRVNLSADEFGKLMPKLTAGGTGPITGERAKININTAPTQVLACLPTLTDADASAITAYRATNVSSDPSNIAWLLTVISRDKAVSAGAMVTGQTRCYSADIVASSGDGRAFKRVRIVIDASSGTARIVYRRDLTNLGWPLDASVRAALRSGQGVNVDMSNVLTGKGG